MNQLSKIYIILCQYNSLLKLVADILSLVWAHESLWVNDWFSWWDLLWFFFNLSPHIQQKVHMILDCSDCPLRLNWVWFVFSVCFKQCHNLVTDLIVEHQSSRGPHRLVIQSHVFGVLSERFVSNCRWHSFSLVKTHCYMRFRATENILWSFRMSRLKRDAQSLCWQGTPEVEWWFW